MTLAETGCLGLTSGLEEVLKTASARAEESESTWAETRAWDQSSDMSERSGLTSEWAGSLEAAPAEELMTASNTSGETELIWTGVETSGSSSGPAGMMSMASGEEMEITSAETGSTETSSTGAEVSRSITGTVEGSPSTSADGKILGAPV